MRSKSRSRRRRWSSEQRDQFLAAFHQSKMTQRDFANSHGGGLSTLNKWLLLGRNVVPAKVKFQEVGLLSPASPWPVEIVSPRGLDRAAASRFARGDAARTVAGAAALSLSSATRVLVATTPVDLRGSFNRLYSLVVEQLKADPLSGHLFVFTNRRRNRIKVLYWDGSGLWVCAKRLEKGRFTWPVSDEGQIALRGEEFSALIHGLEVRSKKNWYRR